MKLELGFIQIRDIQFSKECKVESGTLYVNADEVKDFIFQDDDVKACVKAAHFDIAKPGESVRITPVKDVIEPRVKVEGPGGEFPGVIAKVDTVGSGKTHEFAEKYGGDSLKFCALNTTKARRLAIGQKILGLPVIAVYENGEMIDSCVKDDATPENVEEMIKKYV